MNNSPWVYDSSNDEPLSVELDTCNFEGLNLCEIWVKSDIDTTFEVYGSVSGVNWRWVDGLKVPHGGRTDRHQGFLNAYRYIKVSTPDVGVHEIEIVTGV